MAHKRFSEIYGWRDLPSDSAELRSVRDAMALLLHMIAVDPNGYGTHQLSSALGYLQERAIIESRSA